MEPKKVNQMNLFRKWASTKAKQSTHVRELVTRRLNQIDMFNKWTPTIQKRMCSGNVSNTVETQNRYVEEMGFKKLTEMNML